MRSNLLRQLCPPLQKAGNLYSIATAGSIAGTFVTLFALIPSLEITAIIFALDVCL